MLGASTTPTAVYYSPYEDQAIYQLAAGDPTKLIRNATHDYGVNLRSRVLTCNYKVVHDPQAFQASRYWVQHQIGSKQASSCLPMRPRSRSRRA